MLSEKEIKEKRKLFSDIDKNMVMTFKVLSEINRYRIFRILAEQPKLSVSSIAKILNISLPLASQHLKILTHAKLLQKDRLGNKVYTKLEHDSPFVQAVVKTIQQTQKMLDQKI